MLIKKGNLSNHSGNFLLFFLAAILACASLCKKKPEENYLEPINVSNSPGSAWYEPSITIDSKGNIHLVWTEGLTGVCDNEQIFYATKPAGGNWSVPVNISNTNGPARFPFITVDKNDNLHLVWQQWATVDQMNQIAGWTIFYKYRNSDGNWTPPETLYWNLFSSCPILAVDNEENRYLVWTSYTGRYWLTYAMRDKEGTWTIPVILSEGKTSFGEARLFVDQNNRVHLFFSKGDIGETRFFYYTFRTPETPWSNFEEVYQLDDDWFNPSLFIDESNNLHLYWRSSEDGKPIYYQKRDSSGAWSQPVSLFSAYSFCLFKNSANNLHLVWERRKHMFHSQNVGEKWTEPDTIKVRDLTVETATLKGVIDADNKFHMVWIQNMGFEVPTEIYYVSFKPQEVK